jgi:hypothetical protein
MREYLGTAFNEIFVRTDKAVSPRSEVVIITSEPKWEADTGGILTRRVVDEYRVVMSRDALRSHAKALAAQADRLDVLAEDIGSIVFSIPTE